MTWQGIRRMTAVVVAMVVALALAACGGSEDEEPDASDAPAASQPSASEDSAGQGSEREKKDREEDSAEEDSDEADEADEADEGEPGDDGKDSGRIEDIGEPANPEDREAMITAVKSYFKALANKDPAAACRWLASDTKEELQRLFEKSEIEGDCERFLQYAASVFSQKDAPDFSAIKFSRFRVDGDRGIAFYKVPGRPHSFIVTAREAEGWRVAGIDGTPKP